jgi:hypothetical protein
MIVILKSSIVETCDGFPSQWNAKTIDNRDVYIRYRHGFLSIDINDVEYFHHYTKREGGIMSKQVMIKLLKKLLLKRLTFKL